MDNPKRSGVHNAANSRDGVKNTIVLISTISIVYMATMHSTICALDQGLEPKTIARGKTIQRIVHKTRTIGQEDKRETTWTQSITTRVPVKLYRMDGWMDVWIYIYIYGVKWLQITQVRQSHPLQTCSRGTCPVDVTKYHACHVKRR